MQWTVAVEKALAEFWARWKAFYFL